MKTYWIENRLSGVGEPFEGSFKDAMQRAFDLCVSEMTRISVYVAGTDLDDIGSDKLIAIQNIRGPFWVREDYR